MHIQISDRTQHNNSECIGMVWGGKRANRPLRTDGKKMLYKNMIKRNRHKERHTRIQTHDHGTTQQAM